MDGGGGVGTGLREAVQARFDAHRHKVLATLRRDGSPRISGIEAGFGDWQLWRGMMEGSRKARDLQRDPRLALPTPYGPLRAVGVLALLWVGWHAPVIGALASFRDRGLSGIEAAPLFAPGIACLTVVLVWLVSSGSVLIAALAHGTYNMVSATGAAEGAVGMVATVLIMLAAATLVVVQSLAGATGCRARRALDRVLDSAHSPRSARRPPCAFE